MNERFAAYLNYIFVCVCVPSFEEVEDTDKFIYIISNLPWRLVRLGFISHNQKQESGTYRYNASSMRVEVAAVNVIFR